MALNAGVGGIIRTINTLRAGVGGVNKTLSSLKCEVGGIKRELLQTLEPVDPTAIVEMHNVFGFSDGTGAINFTSSFGNGSFVETLFYINRESIGTIADFFLDVKVTFESLPSNMTWQIKQFFAYGTFFDTISWGHNESGKTKTITGTHDAAFGDVGAFCCMEGTSTGAFPVTVSFSNFIVNGQQYILKGVLE